MKIAKQNVLKENMDTMFEAISEAIGERGDKINASQLMSNRQYILSQIIEMYSMWKQDFDCLPPLIQIGAYEPKFVRIVECDVYGKLINGSKLNEGLE